jgi:predicted ATPase/class 3 adenylate cyclase
LAAAGITTFLFSDIEGSTRLWEESPEAMGRALAAHDALVRSSIGEHGGTVVKMTGDGVHAAFADPRAAISAAVALLLGCARIEEALGLPFRVRCGLHAGTHEQRDADFYGNTVNRAARIMSVAHGGQVLVSHAVATLVSEGLPPGMSLRRLGTVRLRGLAHEEQVHQVVHRELRDDFPPLRALAAAPHNLPQPLTTFVGREALVGQAIELVRASRLVTLVGAGGIGKTRLSLRVASEVVDEFADGAWFVELAPLTDPLRVPQAVASALHVKEEAGRSVLDVLVGQLADRRLLLVLDNCEHLLEACARLAGALLAAAPGVSILASSREPLHVGGERCCPVPVLPAPPPGVAASPEALDAFDAVKLFVERARAVAPQFAVTPRNAHSVAAICRRLDGIPLALELAAARVRAMGVADIAARLDDRFALLQSRDRLVLPRHQTLTALIDWSYDLLDDDERKVFGRLAVFAGGFTLEAAEAIAADASLAGSVVVDALMGLVEKSLVIAAEEEGRYHVLETIRAYALHRLEATGETAAARQRHFEHFLALAERARTKLIGPDQGAWLVRLDTDRENLIAAHAHAVGRHADAAQAIQLMAALNLYWIFSGTVGLGLRLTSQALARLPAGERGALRRRALFDAGQLAICKGAYADGRRLLDESVAIARELGDEVGEGGALPLLCMASLAEGDLASARVHADAALVFARRIGDQRRIAAALVGRAQVHRAEGELEAAERMYVSAYDIAASLGDRETMAIALLNQAMVALGRGDRERALHRACRVVEIVRETGSRAVGQGLLDVAAALAADARSWSEAARYFGAAEAQTEATGIRRDAADEAAVRPWRNATREALGVEAFERLFREGAAAPYGFTLDALFRDLGGGAAAAQP